jgi:non-specific protein-tyrosine kinase
LCHHAAFGGRGIAEGDAMNQHDATTELTLLDYVRPVLSRWWLILGLVVVVTAGTYAYYDRQPKVFETSTRLFSDSSNQNTGLIFGTQGSYVDYRATQNQATLLTSGQTARRVARRLSFPASPGELAGSVRAEASEDTDFITISARRPDGAQAAEVANAFAQEFINARSEDQRRSLEQALTQTQRQIDRLPPRRSNEDERANLAATIRRIKLALSLPGGTTTQLDAAAVPSVPIEPNPKKNATFGFVLALLVGIALAYGLERFDRRLKRVDEAEPAYGTTLLSVIPHAAEPAATVDGEVALAPEFREAFRQLRTSIQLEGLTVPIKRILVTSAVPGEGKSTVVRNLAIAFREFGSDVVVVDGDLRRPTQAQGFGVAAVPGLTNVLTGETSLESSLREVPVHARGLETLARMDAATDEGSGAVALATNGDAESRGLRVLAAGQSAANPQAVLAARGMDLMLKALDEQADVVLIDSPPVLAVSDALALAGEVDAVVLVSRIGVSTRDGAARARVALGRVPNARVVGVVVNDLKGAAGSDYRYGYGDSA